MYPAIRRLRRTGSGPGDGGVRTGVPVGVWTSAGRRGRFATWYKISHIYVGISRIAG